MPRFGVAFNRRKSTAAADELQNAMTAAPEQPSFRVIERSDVSNGKSFDGGARLARASGTPLPPPKHHLELGVDDNMFADLKGNNRGSGASNTTKATSTDASSRHSNASTAPSSADLAHDDWRHSSKKGFHDVPPRSSPKSSGSSFLNRAGRTFSFGQKKGSSSPQKEYPIDDIPPVPAFRHDDFSRRSRGFTESTSSTATPPKLENENIDMGGDFGSMFSSLDKRASMNALKNEGSAAPRSLTGNRPMQPPPLSIDKTTRVDPPPESWNSQGEHEGLLGSEPPSPDEERPPPVPRHQTSYKALNRPSDILEDEDAKLLQDSIAATRLLEETEPPPSDLPSGRWAGHDGASFTRNPATSSFKKGDDNLFEGSAPAPRGLARQTPKGAGSQGTKVMTPAEFERYRKDKEWEKASEKVRQQTTNDDDEEDEINYDDDDDDWEKSKQQAKQRRQQEAHMAVYRQQMMKVTGEQPGSHPERPPIGGGSMSAPQLSHMKASSPQPGVSDEDDDEEVPLAILQAHGFPNRNRPPTRLSVMGSNPNLRASAQMQQPPRAGSVMGDASSGGANAQRASMLPAFARNLPQDPFVGAGIARPAVRESLAFAGGAPASQPQPSMAPGGLVGVIANEERSRALRRGSPNVDNQKFMAPGFDPISGMPPHMMYGMGGPGAMNGMHQQMPQQPQQQTLSVGDQAQLQMTQQMSQFMQMQMQFMQMMAQNGGQQQMAQLPPQIQMQMPYNGFGGAQSVNDLSSARNSMVGEPMMRLEPGRQDAGMRTMSMVQPSSSSFLQTPGYAGSIHGGMGMGYTPSIAPSERSNVGLPGRYRPVTQASAAPSLAVPTLDGHRRTNTMSGALGRWDENKPKPTINVVSKAGDDSDSDDEEGWEAMKAKRDEKRSLWKTKKSFGAELSAMI